VANAKANGDSFTAAAGSPVGSGVEEQRGAGGGVLPSPSAQHPEDETPMSHPMPPSSLPPSPGGVRASSVAGGGLDTGAAATATAATARRQSRMGGVGGAAGVGGPGLGELGGGKLRASFHEAAAAARRTSMAAGSGDPVRRRQSVMLGGGPAPAAAAGGGGSGGGGGGGGGGNVPSSSFSSSSVVKQKFTVTDDIIRQIKNSRQSRGGSLAWSPRSWRRGLGSFRSSLSWSPRGSSRGSIMDTEELVNAYVELVCEDLKTNGACMRAGTGD
jgi:hypothetical protein